MKNENGTDFLLPKYGLRGVEIFFSYLMDFNYVQLT